MLQVGYPKEIVAAVINGTKVTNNPATIRDNISNVSEWLDRGRMQLMAAFDLGPHWKELAEAPTLFCISEDGTPVSSDAREQGNS